MPVFLCKQVTHLCSASCKMQVCHFCLFLHHLCKQMTCLCSACCKMQVCDFCLFLHHQNNHVESILFFICPLPFSTWKIFEWHLCPPNYAYDLFPHSLEKGDRLIGLLGLLNYQNKVYIRISFWKYYIFKFGNSRLLELTNITSRRDISQLTRC